MPVRRPRGMGGAAPVADNGTAHGRQRNRRVEVWLAPRGTLQAGRETASGTRNSLTDASASRPAL